MVSMDVWVTQIICKEHHILSMLELVHSYGWHWIEVVTIRSTCLEKAMGTARAAYLLTTC